MNLNQISVTILTKNCEKTLGETLNSLRRFNEVVVYDNGSKDGTLALFKDFPNVKLYEGPFYGFGKTHNMASNLASNKWIFSIDSDEVVTQGLLDEISKLELNKTTVYAVSRKNYYNQKWIYTCGWHPDYQYRIYHRDATAFTEAEVHEQVITKGLAIHRLKEPLVHTSYHSLSDFLAKMQHYSELFAAENTGRKKSSPCKAVLHGCFAFFKSYFIKRGILNGYEGFAISSYNGATAFYKYLKLYESNRKASMTGRKSKI